MMMHIEPNKSVVIFKLDAIEDEALKIWWDTLFLLDLHLEIHHSIIWANVMKREHN